ncbi:hypothetical protein [Acanthopleuribacter pedis]|uniref:T9SS C-terminal target domain-containing protein n=1 Tax=Acanthopleuribacter pedis TaxID=442870 RepID=A0A8J7QFV9_9BACT|nr:hypothetical protein [Acanthopleuribacter pedis]MBO1321615.1 hypothetical protein [Acanthopleuribacter pedis]
MSTKLTLWFMLCVLPFAVMAQTVINDDTIGPGQEVTLAAGEYTLSGLVFVEEGAVLTIEAGAVFKAEQTQGENTSALIVARGGRIEANGTAANPIIFTSELDDLNDPNDLGPEDRGLWGGIILLGRATNNRGVEGQIEGIPSDEVRGAYGGDNDADNSGTMRYVSIRHGGSTLGAGDEINGLTFGSVGSGTTIEFIEVYANFDDGFEWFGGTVGTKNIVAAYCGDDAFDYDEGWRGKNQFWFALLGSDNAGAVGEHDGGTVQETAEPYSRPYIVNATYIGPGISATPQGDRGEAIYFRDNAGGIYMSSIVTMYNGANGGLAVNVEDIEGPDSRERLENGDLALRNNIWWQFGAGNTLEEIVPQDFVREHVAANNNTIENPQLGFIDRGQSGTLDPRPSQNGPAAYGATQPADAFFSPVAYKGAFSPVGPLWTDGWTALSATNHTRSKARWVGHVTALGAGFNTNLHMSNSGSADYTMNVTPYGADGSALTARTADVPAGQTVVVSNSDFFGGENVSHFFVDGSNKVAVTASYSADVANAANAELNETSKAWTFFSFYTADNNLVFDGGAFINTGGAPAVVTAVQKAADGSVLAAVTLSDGIPTLNKMLALFNTDAGFVNQPGSLIEVTSSQPLSVVLLRGTYPGVAPAYLYVTNPNRAY